MTWLWTKINLSDTISQWLTDIVIGLRNFVVPANIDVHVHTKTQINIVIILNISRKGRWRKCSVWSTVWRRRWCTWSRWHETRPRWRLLEVPRFVNTEVYQKSFILYIVLHEIGIIWVLHWILMSCHVLLHPNPDHVQCGSLLKGWIYGKEQLISIWIFMWEGNMWSYPSCEK